MLRNKRSKLTLGSLFDGSGGFPLGGLLAGITPIWASEIEPFPIRVTTKRLPFMKHYGDVSKMHGGKIEPVDIITFGSPCQDMSVAGKRAGLDGSRSNLFYEAIRIVKEMRCATNGEYPRFIVWENVPGAFSSNKGQDFRSVLEAICSVKGEDISVPEPPKGKWSCAGSVLADGFSLAWRTLDAQFWGVPQRRRRIFLVANFAGTCAEQILFKSEGLSRYSAEVFRSWQRATGSTADCTRTTSTACLNDQGGQRMEVTDGVTCTLRAEAHGNLPCILQAYGICSDKSNSMLSHNPHSGVYEAHTSRTIDANGGNPSCNQGGMAVVGVAQNQQTYVLQGSMIGRKDDNGPRGGGVNKDVSFTLNTTDRHAVCAMTTGSYMQSTENQSPTLLARDYKDPVTVAYGIGRDAMNQGRNAQFAPSVSEEVQPTLVANGPGAVAKAEPEYIVRRLTPTECARLQGFPDWWCAGLETAEPTEDYLSFWREVFETHRKIAGTSTKPKTDRQIIKWLKDPYSDSAEYKLWGNGVALPCVYFVLAGIAWAAQEKAVLCNNQEFLNEQEHAAYMEDFTVVVNGGTS